MEILLIVTIALTTAAAAQAPSSSNQTEGSCLKLLMMLHRHGDRAPIHKYPNDIYEGFEYLPGGRGNLNKAGKVHAYELGLTIRRLYDKFLGRERLPGTVRLRSTRVPRALESGALVLAAVYPPEGDGKWDYPLGQAWSPAAFTTAPTERDLLLQAVDHCPALADDNPDADAYIKKELDKMKEAVQHLANHSGVAADNPQALLRVADTLIAQESCGLKLPDWANQVSPQVLRRILGLVIGGSSFTKRQRRLSAGLFLNEIVNTTLAWSTQQLPARLKFCQYSAHDSTLLPVLSALGVDNGLVPPFASAILIEVHRCDGSDAPPGLKFLYRNETNANPHELLLPGCDVICPLPQFRNLYKDIVVSSDEQIKECRVKDQ